MGKSIIKLSFYGPYLFNPSLSSLSRAEPQMEFEGGGITDNCRWRGALGPRAAFLSLIIGESPLQ